jgi:hypothetical protein
MRTTRITAPIAAVLGAAVLAGPAAARPIEPSQPVRSNSHEHAAKVYVPPADLWPDTTYRPSAATHAAIDRAPIVKPAASSPDSGFNWEAAGVGAVAGGAVAFGLAEVTRRRPRRPANA